MMKFLVDELPYYGEECPFWTHGMCYSSDNECPRCWSKYQVCSEDNPHECEWLKEIECDEICVPRVRGEIFVENGERKNDSNE